MKKKPIESIRDIAYLSSIVSEIVSLVLTLTIFPYFNNYFIGIVASVIFYYVSDKLLGGYIFPFLIATAFILKGIFKAIVNPDPNLDLMDAMEKEFQKICDMFEEDGK